MKIFLKRKLIELCRSPFLKKMFEKTFHGAVTAGTLYEIKESFVVSFNKSQPIYTRAMATIKASCCSIALISAYSSQSIPNPRLAAAFRVCCYSATFGYSMAGGDMKLALGLSSLVSNNQTVGNQLSGPFSADQIAKPRF